MRGKIEMYDADNNLLESYVDVDERGTVRLSINDFAYRLSVDGVAVLDKAIGDSINQRVKILERRK